MTMKMRIALGALTLAAALGLAACGGGGGGFGDTPSATPASPLTGQFVGAGATVNIDGNGYLVGHTIRAGADGTDTVTFSGTVSELGDGKWQIPFALISTTITPNGAPPAQFTTRGTVTGTFASRSMLAFTLPAAAVPPGMAAGQTAAYVNANPVNVPDIFGPYYWTAGSPPTVVRTFEVKSTSRIAGTYVPDCQIEGPIYVLDGLSAIYTADLLFTGPTCPDVSGNTRRLVGTFTPGDGGVLRMFFVDNAGNLLLLEGRRGLLAPG